MGKKAQIPAGDYIFGEDIPTGKYDLKAVSGDATLEFFRKGKKQPELSFLIGTGEDDNSLYTGEYKNLRTSNGDRLKLEGSVIVEIAEAGKIEFTNG